MKLKTPDSIVNGHENLRSELEDIINVKGDIGEAAKLLYEVMTKHFQKEEKYAFPPLSLLLIMSQGHWEFNADEAIKMTETLESRLSELAIEHEGILKALKVLKNVADNENNSQAKQFVKDLIIHVEIEDQVLYPSTILIGNFLKHLKHEK